MSTLTQAHPQIHIHTHTQPPSHTFLLIKSYAEPDIRCTPCLESPHLTTWPQKHLPRPWGPSKKAHWYSGWDGAQDKSCPCQPVNPSRTLDPCEGDRHKACKRTHRVDSAEQSHVAVCCGATVSTLDSDEVGGHAHGAGHGLMWALLAGQEGHSGSPRAIGAAAISC